MPLLSPLYKGGLEGGEKVARRYGLEVLSVGSEAHLFTLVLVMMEACNTEIF